MGGAALEAAAAGAAAIGAGAIALSPLGEGVGNFIDQASATRQSSQPAMLNRYASSPSAASTPDLLVPRRP
jgi:hypothetical protein